MFVVIFTLAVLMLAGLVFDGGLAIAGRQRAADVAEAAARAAANAVNVEDLRAGVPPRVNQAEGCQQAQEIVARDGDGALVDCFVEPGTAQAVHVAVRITVRPVLLTLFRLQPFEVRAQATAEPLRGV